MEPYILDNTFMKTGIIEQFSSVIWTERFTKTGDFQLVVPASAANIAKLPEKVFVGLPESQEVMHLETVSIENDTLTVSGPSLLDVLQQRITRFSPSHSAKTTRLSPYTPGQLMAYVVDQMCISLLWVDGYDSAFNYMYDQKIDGLQIGSIDNSGTSAGFDIPFGQLLDFLNDIATNYTVGQSLYLESANDAGYVLKYKTYAGVDRTSSQGTYKVVRFSEINGTLQNVKELRSMTQYKSECWAFWSGETISGWDDNEPGTAFSIDNGNNFDRRILQIWVDDIDPSVYAGFGDDAYVRFLNELDKRAANALANNNYIKYVDGEVNPQVGEYTYGVDYNLGDIVELQASDGTLQKARITEFIRSQDSSGYRAYPTIELIG